MGTQPKLWTLDTLRSARSDGSGVVEVDPNNPVVFTIPQFQRSLVWPEQKQRALIESILKGFPFGALLLVENDEKKPVDLPDGSTIMATNYGIIDGLQRTNAIVEHLRQSLFFATADAVNGAPFEKLHQDLETCIGMQVQSEKLMDAVVEWMRATKTPDITKGFDFDTLLKAIADGLGLSPSQSASVLLLKGSASVLLQHIAKAVDISRLQIPVLVYNGPKEYLPDIFEQINTAGTVLSKYEVFAAAWASTVVDVEHPGVKSAISRRYKLLEEQGFTVEASLEGNEYTLFDYLHGLSQCLGETYPNLFSKKDAKRNKLSSAFPLATLMLGESLAVMGSLDGLFPKLGARLEVAKFEKALFGAADLVDRILSPFLAFKLTSDTEALAHGELQMVSMVAAAAAHLYDRTADFADRGSAAERLKFKKAFERALPQHYIYDIIRQQWRGSLYTYAAERVWVDGVPAEVYTKPIEASVFDSALAASLREQLSDVSHKRKNVTAADRVFLKFLYSKVVSVHDQNANKFDVEHWIPVNRIVKMVGDAPPWPMGALGNLGVLPAGPNRIKRDETVTEYLERPKKRPSDATVEIVNKMVLVPIERVNIEKLNNVDSMSQEQFEEFVTANWTEMGERLKANVDI